MTRERQLQSKDLLLVFILTLHKKKAGPSTLLRSAQDDTG